MAGVNGIEIKVGQVWRTGGGELVEIKEHDTTDTTHPWLGSDDDWYTNAGWYSQHGASPKRDLIELVKDENGFTIWRGGEQQPEDTRGTSVEVYKHNYDSPLTVMADAIKRWERVARYKVVEQAATPQPADSATLAEETLIALGWTFDGQAWVENAVVELPIGMVDSPVSAPALLTAAAKHMNDRAATYDKPEGERSMAQTVAVFEAYHGIKLTEAQGWHFMQVLKDVRLFTSETYHADSAEDCIAYAALKAEAKAQEGGA